MSHVAENCRHCQKSGLSLLLLRPSPIALQSGLQAPGSANARADDALTQPYIPAGLTESRPVLRLLRAGYVHLYIPAKDRWQTLRVSNNADLLREDHPLFASLTSDSVCTRDGHNASGFKLLHIPQAHELMGQSIWLAFSANRWSTQLKARNKANPKVMVEVTLGSASAPAFKPDVASLKRQILECNVLNWWLPAVELALTPTFPFTSLAKTSQIDNLAAVMQQAAAAHPKTLGHEMAVVLPDPVGYAAELNALRLARFELAKQEMAKPENAHPLASLQMLDGLRQSVVDADTARSWDAVRPVVSQSNYLNAIKVPPPRGWPKDTRWEPLTDAQEVKAHGPGMGRAIFPDDAQRAQRFVQQATEYTWSLYRKYVNEGRITSWKAAFDQKMQTQHGEPLKRFEADWWKASRHARVIECFDLHFDEQDPNPVGMAHEHSPGATYAGEVHLCLTPQPLTQGSTLDSYLQELEKAPTDKSAQLQRALAGNQGIVLTQLNDYMQNQRPDKLHDLGAGLLKGADENTILGVHHVRYGWMLHAGYAASTLAITQSLSAALSGSAWVAGALGSAAGIGPKGRQLIERVQALLMASQALQLATNSALTGTRLEVPVVVQVSLSGEEARKLLIQRASSAGNTQTPPVRETNSASGRGGGQLTLYLTTTNLELVAAAGSAKAAMAAGAGSVSLNQPQALSMSKNAQRVTAEAFANLMQRQTSKTTKAAAAVSEMVVAVKGATLNLDGHIGLIGLLLNGWSMYGTITDDKKKLSDWVTLTGFSDATAGTIGGLAQVAASSVGAVVEMRAGAKAVKTSLWVMGLGVVAHAAGAAGGLATAIGQFVKRSRSDDPTIRALYGLSGVAFLGQSFTSLTLFIGSFSEFMIARGSQRALWFVGARLSAAANARLVLYTRFGLTGWGLVFLAAGIALEVTVVVLTCTALQKHVERSYFGTGADRYTGLKEENAGLEALIPVTAPEPVKYDSATPGPVLA